MGKKTAKWQAELWSYLSAGDGVRCPMYSCCAVTKQGVWGANDNEEQLCALLCSGRFNSGGCNLIEQGGAGRAFQLVEMLARDYLKRGNVRCPPTPLELVSLADKQHTIEVRLVPLKGYHGVIWRLDEGWIIQLNENDMPDARRFTLFHEAFHVLAHCKTAPVFRKRGTEEGFFNEILADYFAACVLMPGEWVEEKWAKFNDLNQMARIFAVPEALMRIRLMGMGLI